MEFPQKERQVLSDLASPACGPCQTLFWREQDGHLAEGICMCFKKRSSSLPRQAGTARGQVATVPWAFLLFRISSACTQDHEWKESRSHDVERHVNGGYFQPAGK